MFVSRNNAALRLKRCNSAHTAPDYGHGVVVNEHELVPACPVNMLKLYIAQHEKQLTDLAHLMMAYVNGRNMLCKPFPSQRFHVVFAFA